MDSSVNLSAVTSTAYSSAVRSAGAGAVQKDPPMPPMPPMPPVICVGYGSPYSQPLLDKGKAQKIEIWQDDTKTTFYVENIESYNSGQDIARMNEISELISRMNIYVNGEKVRSVSIVNNCPYSGHYNHITHEIEISSEVFRGPNYLSVIAHEMGHAIGLSMPKDEQWLKIFYFSLGSGRYAILSRGNYVLSKTYGHHFFNPNELFASAVMAYVVHPERLVECTNDPGNMEGTRELGAAIFCYLRDKVFNGRSFCRVDPFEGLTSQNIIDSITDDDILCSLVSALHDKTSDGTMNPTTVGDIPGRIITCLALNDGRFAKIVKEESADKDTNVRRAIINAAFDIAKDGVRDDLIISIIIRGLHDKDSGIRRIAELAVERNDIKIKKNFWGHLNDFFHGLFHESGRSDLN